MIFKMDNFLNTEECQLFLDFYKDSPDKFRGGTVGDSSPDKDIKNDIEVLLPADDGEDLSDLLSSRLNESITKFLGEISKNTDWDYNNLFQYGSYYDGFKIQYYKKNEGNYNIWHQERDGSQEFSRLFAFLIYLNTVEEGGETEFLFVKPSKFKPVKGTLIVFPAGFPYVHRGHVPISSDKYIIAGWLNQTIELLISNFNSLTFYP